MVGSGTYTTGNCMYTPYTTAATYIYDSVKYNNSLLGNTRDYYTIQKDTLTFNAGFAGYIGSSNKIFVKG